MVHRETAAARAGPEVKEEGLEAQAAVPAVVPVVAAVPEAVEGLAAVPVEIDKASHGLTRK